MSSLKALALSGIRSFGPEEQDRQRISFTKPLTLILGENGCGKTTLLEALKFALCDELPPNADFGRSFLHDPSLSRVKDTRAQIRLEFVDNNETRYLVIRSMQVQQKLKKLQFQRLDHCLQTVDRQGNTAEISGRCGDTNSTICSILGISKAVLNNVIFCHQEDSNWPLDEGKKLKERFDAIFDATKYSKCFDQIKKLRKQYSTDIKMLEQDVKHCTEIKVEYENKIQKLHNYEEKIDESKKKLVELQSTLKPILQKLKEIEAVEDNFLEIKSEKELARIGLKNCLNQQNELKNVIQNIYEGSEEKLIEEIELFSENVAKKEKSLNSASKLLENLKKMDVEINKKISTIDKKKSELMTLEGQNQEKISTRNKYLLEIATVAELPAPDSLDNEENEISELTSKIKVKLESLQNDIKDFMANADAEEKQLQKNIDTHRDALARNEESILNRKKECDKLKTQIKKLELEISDADTSKTKLKHLKEEMESSDKYFQDLSNQFDINDCEKIINDEEIEINKLETDLDELQKNISILQNQNSKTAEIGFQNETLLSKQKSFTLIKNKNKDTMIKLKGKNIPENNFKRTFLDYQKDLKEEVTNLNKQIKEKQQKVASLEAGRIHQKKELDKKKKELEDGEEKLYKYCKSQNLEDVLIKIDTEINKYQDQKSELSSSEFVIRRFTDKLKDSNPCCPLCHRGFESQKDVSDLIEELNDKVRSVPQNLKSVTDRLSKLLPERDQLISFRPINTQIKHLKNEEIPSLQKKLQDIDKELEACGEDVEDHMMGLIEPEANLTAVENMLSDMTLLDQLANDISFIKSEIVKLESEFEATSLNMSLDEANTKQSSLKQNISRLKSSIKANQSKLKSHNGKLNTARDKKNQLKEKYLQCQAKVQEAVSLQNRYDEVTETLSKAESDKEILMNASSKLQSDLNLSEREKKTALENNRKKIDKKRKHFNGLDKMYSTLMGFCKEIDEHNSKNVMGELELLKNSLESLINEKNNNSLNIKNETDNINHIKDEIANQKMNKRELDDNLNYKKSKNKQLQFEKQICELDKKIGNMNYSNLTKEKESLLRSQNKSLLEKASTEGEIKQLQENVTQTKTELKQNQYKNINNQYRSKFYDLHLLKTAEKDLKDYAFAMDYCLMKYHKDKMKSINASIRDMWRNIYRGNDIDYIEIKTDEIMSNTSTTNRRVYDYRVVQYRNDVDIDMRGRCSAGQKVLASLIIRMALAENFSHRFGVLALDEPTSNLDRENTSSLCLALKDMITARLSQNFMFIIITHDNEFLSSLGSIDKITHYYRVTRNQEGKSRITKERMT